MTFRRQMKKGSTNELSIQENDNSTSEAKGDARFQGEKHNDDTVSEKNKDDNVISVLIDSEDKMFNKTKPF